MEDLFPAIVVIIGIIGSIISSSKKAKEKNAAEEKRKAAAAARIQAAQQKQAAKAASVFPPVPAAASPVIMPTVHTHIEPECDTHDQPGSLGVTSLEGKDPCHEDELTLERTFAEVPEQEGGLTFNWTGDSMVKAVVMQEVLTRPIDRARTCQRYAR